MMKKVFLLGDSVSLHYAPYLKEYLQGKVELQGKQGRDEALRHINRAVGACGGDSADVLAFVRELTAGGKPDFDVFLFNCGLHDIKRLVPEEALQVPVDAYAQNLREIFALLAAHGVRCVFITTTPVYEQAHYEQMPDGIRRYNADVYACNEAAVQAAQAQDVPVIDLCGFVEKIPEEVHLDYAHFNFPTRKLQAAFIAGNLLSLLL